MTAESAPSAGFPRREMRNLSDRTIEVVAERGEVQGDVRPLCERLEKFIIVNNCAESLLRIGGKKSIIHFDEQKRDRKGDYREA